MNYRTILLLPLAAVSLEACDTVTSPVPLGEKPAVLEAEEWEGRWTNADGYLDLVVTDAANGLVRIAYEDVPEDECREMELQLRTSGEWTFFSVTEADFERSEGLASSPCAPTRSATTTDVGPAGESGSASYLWGRVRLSDNAIYAWGPDPGVFVRLVNQGHLPGTVDEGNVVLGPLSTEHYEVIISGSQGVVLDWENPLVLYRVKPGNSD